MKSSLLISSNFVSNRVVSSNKAQITGAGHLALPQAGQQMTHSLNPHAVMTRWPYSDLPCGMRHQGCLPNTGPSDLQGTTQHEPRATGVPPSPAVPGRGQPDPLPLCSPSSSPPFIAAVTSTEGW